ncbi:MAG: hypothetical protein KBG40_09055 [Bacteroidales bacterium]|nr:hypothetical protein [Bacteroidales bacterium]
MVWIKEQRADYGAKFISALGRQLESEFDAGWSRRSLFNMVRFAEVFQDKKLCTR